MKAPLEWLKEFVDIRISPDEMVDRLTMSGIEVSSLEFHGKIVEGVVVGKVKGKAPHPQVPDMSIVQVDIGKIIIQAVIPTHAASVGDKVPVAPEGSTLAKGLKVKRISYHGVECFGQLCCGHEIGVEFTERILTLPKDAQIGEDVRKVIGLGGYVFDLDILPNRGDCLSIYGIAQEISAIIKKPLKKYAVRVAEKGLPAKSRIQVEVKDKDLCPRYMCRVIDNVKVKESPQWLKNRLLLAGLRPINNVVDVTNYVLLETGQPLHAFDAERLDGKKIIVRRASKGEKIKTLDEIDRELIEDDLVIADLKKAVALAGIMGGVNSAVNPATRTVILESAYFSPQCINKTSRRLKVKTDASMRFERGVDWGKVSLALDKAAMMLAEFAEGGILKGLIDIKGVNYRPLRIKLRAVRIKQILGVNVTMREAREILQRLGMRVVKVNHSQQTLLVEVPGSREMDITREIDLIEEIARIHGYAYIPADIASTAFENKKLNLSFPFIAKIKDCLKASGLDEVSTYSMVNPNDIKRVFTLEQDKRRVAMPLANPLSEEESMLRTSLFTGLMNIIKYNQFRQMPDVAIFEVGKVYYPTNEGIDEKLFLAGAVVGPLAKNLIAVKQLNPDFYWVKSIIENVFEEIKAKNIEIIKGEDVFIQPGSGAQILFNGKKIGSLGCVHPKISRQFDVNGTAIYFEISLDEMIAALPFKAEFFAPLPKVPQISRDIAMFTPEDIASAEIEKTILSAGQPLIESVSLFDYYKGKPVPTGYINLAYRITYRDKERTLTDEEVSRKHEDVLRALQDKYNLQIRR